nr:arginine--tRNA ligase [Candidatus Brocadiales bacterium]
MKQQLAAALEKTLENLNRTWNVEELPAAEVEIPRDAAMGDLATTVAMRLTKILRKPPKDIAALIISEITSIEPDLFETAEIAGPGFINFRFKRSYLLNRLERLLTDGSSALPDLGKGQKIQVEFVSANPTGPLHIGHGR